MESHIPMIYHQARLPLFGHVVRRLKRSQNNSVHPTLKSKKRPFGDKLNNGTLEAKKDIEQPLKKQKIDLQEFNPKVENSQLQPLRSDADMLNAEKNTEPKPKIWLVPIEKLVKPDLLPYYYTAFGNVEHGENKVSLYSDKHRCKPGVSDIAIQTDPVEEFPELQILTPMAKEPSSSVNRNRNNSDTSLSSVENPPHITDELYIRPSKPEDQITKLRRMGTERTETEEKTSRNIVNSMKSSRWKNLKMLLRQKKNLIQRMNEMKHPDDAKL